MKKDKGVRLRKKRRKIIINLIKKLLRIRVERGSNRKFIHSLLIPFVGIKVAYNPKGVRANMVEIRMIWHRMINFTTGIAGRKKILITRKRKIKKVESKISCQPLLIFVFYKIMTKAIGYSLDDKHLKDVCRWILESKHTLESDNLNFVLVWSRREKRWNPVFIDFGQESFKEINTKRHLNLIERILDDFLSEEKNEGVDSFGNRLVNCQLENEGEYRLFLDSIQVLDMAG